MLDFVKKLFGVKAPEQAPTAQSEPVIDAIDMTTKVDGIGHESVKAAKKTKAPAKPKTPKAEKTAAKPKKAKTAKK